MNKLCYGDNLEILREQVPDDSIGLVYLDPPFNSKATYNVLFKAPTGADSQAQIEAFEDTWHWNESAEAAFAEILESGNTDVADMISAIRSGLGENDMMAYLTMMTVRLIELHRVLNRTGALYIHCDPNASHYLKIILDALFGVLNFRNEITWKRSTSHGNVSRNYGSLTDQILFYSKSEDYCWNQPYKPFSDSYVKTKFSKQDPDGRSWQSVTLRNPSPRPNLHYPYVASNGVTYQPHPNGWSCNLERMKRYDSEHRLHFPNKQGGKLRLKVYLDESNGVRVQNIWDDIPPVNSQARERLGYPTQKPVALLERIIATSSNEGDVVLDPFCGCGTTIHAAQKLRRRWMGIDVTHLAISIIESRLREAFPDVAYDVEGVPKSIDGARDLAMRDKYQFQWWACSLVGAHPYQGRKRGADGGIDGIIYFRPDGVRGGPERVIVSVKGGENVSVAMIRDLKGVVEREKASIGLFVTLTEPTKPMQQEAVKAGFYQNANWVKVPKIQILTIRDLLVDKQKAKIPALDPTMFRKAEQEVTEQQRDMFDPKPARKAKKKAPRRRKQA